MSEQIVYMCDLDGPYVVSVVASGNMRALFVEYDSTEWTLIYRM
jgi:hypothetical protein